MTGRGLVEGESEVRKTFLEDVRVIPVLSGAVKGPSRIRARPRVLADAEDEVDFVCFARTRELGFHLVDERGRCVRSRFDRRADGPRCQEGTDPPFGRARQARLSRSNRSSYKPLCPRQKPGR